MFYNESDKLLSKSNKEDFIMNLAAFWELLLKFLEMFLSEGTLEIVDKVYNAVLGIIGFFG